MRLFSLRSLYKDLVSGLFYCACQPLLRLVDVLVVYSFPPLICCEFPYFMLKTEQLVDEIEEERVCLKHAIRVLEQDVAALKRHVEEESEGYLER